MINFTDVEFGYLPGSPILNRVTLTIDRGLTLLVGPNGCGKSTLLRVASGVDRPARGKVSIAGLDLWQEEVAARRHLAYLPERAELTPYATVSEILHLVAGLRDEPAASADIALERAGLGDLGTRSVRELSMGQQRRVHLGAARIGSPQCLLLDEPLEGMDRIIRSDLLEWIESRLDAGATVVVASHQIEPFAARAKRVLTVQRGSTQLIDTLPEERSERLALLERMATAA